MPDIQNVPVFLDAGNPLLGPCAARLETGTLAVSGSQLGVVTIRTASTTLTVLLKAADVKVWAKLLTGLGDSMSSSGLTVVSESLLPPGSSRPGTLR